MKKIALMIMILCVTMSLLVGCKSKEVEQEVESSVVKDQESNNSNNEKEDSNQEPVKEETTNQESEKSEIHFINTGNSDAILIKQGNKAALIDGGDNDDDQKVVSYLKNQGISELEYVFATHPHADHIGGLDSVIKSVSVKNLYVSNGDSETKTYSNFINAAASKGLNPSVPLLNSEFKLGNSTFKVLSVANESDTNNTSLVLLYTNGNDKVLLMGDAEKEIEGRLNPGDVDLIKVGHHGSHSSSTNSFINKVNPEYAVITVGADNKYGHPHKETMNTLESKNIEVHRNDECGDIVFTSTGNGLNVNCKKGSYNYGNSSSSSSNNNAGNNVSKPVVDNKPVVENTPVVENEPVVETNPQTSGNMVYANGGSSKSNKYHSSPTAHNMEGAIEMSEDGATSKGYVACKKCY